MSDGGQQGAMRKKMLLATMSPPYTFVKGKMARVTLARDGSIAPLHTRAIQKVFFTSSFSDSSHYNLNLHLELTILPLPYMSSRSAPPRLCPLPLPSSPPQLLTSHLHPKLPHSSRSSFFLLQLHNHIQFCIYFFSF